MLKKGSRVETIVDEYVVTKQINQGGNGTVFCVQNSDGKTLALKAIDRSGTSKVKLKRFRNELYFCQNSTHKNIIKILDYGTYYSDKEDIIFYVMPLYEMTLRDKMNAGIETEEVLPIITQIFDAIKYSHGKKVWHRDIKPENILMDSKGNVVLADFGIAHFCANELLTAVETKTSDRLANFIYAAPEQRSRDTVVDGRADTYAIGLLINEMFTGKVIAGANYETISIKTPQYGYLDNIIEKMICQNPNDRLFPIERISVQILSAQRKEQETSELRALVSSQTETDELYHDIASPIITACDYNNGVLYIHIKDLDYYKSEIWFEELKQGNFSHQSMMGFEKERLEMMNCELITMPVPISYSKHVKQIAQYIKDWLPKATMIFNNKQRALFNIEQREQERQIQAEIERRRAEIKVQEELRSFSI